MISWPAAKQIRCVKPSIATVSPSRTSSRTASCIVVTLRRGHDACRASRGVVVRDRAGRRTRCPPGSSITVQKLPPSSTRPCTVAPAVDQTLDLGRPSSVGRRQVQVQAVLHRLALAARRRTGIGPASAALGSASIEALSVVGSSLDLVAERRRTRSRRAAAGRGSRTLSASTSEAHGIRYEPAGLDLGDGLLEDLEGRSRLVLAEDSGGEMRIASSPHPSASSPRRNAGLLHRGRLIVVGERQPDPQRAAAHLGDDRDGAAAISRSPSRKTSPTARRVRHQPFVLDHVERGERRGARDRRAAVRGTVRARLPGHHVVARDHGAERQPARDALAGRDDVGRHALLLDRPHRAAAPHARLHLVADEQDAVAVAELAQVAEPPLGRQHVARPRRARTPRRSPRPRPG